MRPEDRHLHRVLDEIERDSDRIARLLSAAAHTPDPIPAVIYRKRSGGLVERLRGMLRGARARRVRA